MSVETIKSAKLVLDYQVEFNSVLQSLTDDIREMKSKLNVLEPEMQVRKNVTDNLTKYTKTLECKCYKNEQYSRKKCLGIPAFLAVLKIKLLKTLF